MVSFLQNLFNRKRQTQNNQEPVEDQFHEEEDEELEEDNTEAETEDDSTVNSEASDKEAVYEVVEREIMPAKIICPDCGGITLEGLELCDKCGGELL